MDILIRFSEKGGFYSFRDVKEYLTKTVPEQSYFFHLHKDLKRIEEGDKIYFSYKGQIVGRARFTGKREERNNYYSFGYQIDDIKTFSPIKIDNKLFRGAPYFYINSSEKEEEIHRVDKIIDQVKQKKHYVEKIQINNFTLFKDIELNFSKGLNIFIGANGTGKTHILKLIYSVIKANNSFKKRENTKKSYLARELFNELVDVFRVNKINNLISYDDIDNKISTVYVECCGYKNKFEITENTESEVSLDLFEKHPNIKNVIFIPAQEVLSHFKGFRPLWEEYYLPFDKTFYDLVKSLELPLIKEMSKEQKIINEELENIIEGEIININGEFYLKRYKDNKLIISSLMAEGLRKIGTISYLLKNGSLNSNSVLFWDEPEANLNPKLIKTIVKLLILLEKFGIQIFIATHSLFLIKELEILKSNIQTINYLNIVFSQKNNIQITQSNIFDELEDLVLLDENLEQSDRFMEKVL